MSVSEQASAQDVLADYLPGASTYPGTATRGGWIPILLKIDSVKPMIIDWICPTCKRLLAQSRTCPCCGLEKMAIPRSHPNEPLLREKRLYQYRRWADKVFEDGGQSGCTTENFRPASSIQRASSRSHNIIHRGTAP